MLGPLRTDTRYSNSLSVSNSEDLSALPEAYRHPVRLRTRPLELVDLGARVVREDGVEAKARVLGKCMGMVVGVVRGL